MVFIMHYDFDFSSQFNGTQSMEVMCYALNDLWVVLFKYTVDMLHIFDLSILIWAFKQVHRYFLIF